MEWLIGLGVLWLLSAVFGSSSSSKQVDDRARQKTEDERMEREIALAQRRLARQDRERSELLKELILTPDEQQRGAPGATTSTPLRTDGSTEPSKSAVEPAQDSVCSPVLVPPLETVSTAAPANLRRVPVTRTTPACEAAPEAGVTYYDDAPKPHSASFQLLLFDLDDTLVITSDLSGYRGTENVGNTNASYIQRLTQSFTSGDARIIYPEAGLLRMAREFDLRLGIFTRAPKTYVDTILGLAYPNIRWDTVVTYEDVARTKPYADGVLKAMRDCGLNDPKSVVLIGDSFEDVSAAYRAGCWAVLDKETWPYQYEARHFAAEELSPDTVIDGFQGLAKFMGGPVASLPLLEAHLAGVGPEQIPPRILSGTYFDDLVSGKGHKPVKIFSLGRYFRSEMQSRASWHLLTKSIIDHKDRLHFSDAWVSALAIFLSKQRGSAVVTVIPAKPGRPKRLESLLKQTASVMSDSADLVFEPEILRYLHGAKSHHIAGANRSGLTRVERFRNVRENLILAQPNEVKGRHVIVVDDVLTSGASLIGARDCLLRGGAARVTLLSLAKTVYLR